MNALRSQFIGISLLFILTFLIGQFAESLYPTRMVSDTNHHKFRQVCINLPKMI